MPIKLIYISTCSCTCLSVCLSACWLADCPSLPVNQLITNPCLSVNQLTVCLSANQLTVHLCLSTSCLFILYVPVSITVYHSVYHCLSTVCLPTKTHGHPSVYLPTSCQPLDCLPPCLCLAKFFTNLSTNISSALSTSRASLQLPSYPLL